MTTNDSAKVDDVTEQCSSDTDRPICQHCGRYEENHPAELDDVTCESFRKRFDLHPETLLEAAESLRETGETYDEYLASELEGAFDRSPYVDRSHYTATDRSGVQ